MRRLFAIALLTAIVGATSSVHALDCSISPVVLELRAVTVNGLPAGLQGRAPTLLLEARSASSFDAVPSADGVNRDASGTELYQ